MNTSGELTASDVATHNAAIVEKLREAEARATHAEVRRLIREADVRELPFESQAS